MTEVFQKYIGSGMILSCFLVALVYLFFAERKKTNRILFVYVPIVILLLFYNPIFYRIFSFSTEEAIYFRILWLLPISVVIGYVIVKMCNSLVGIKKYSFCTIAIIIIMISGQLVYTSPLFEKAENIYHVPREVVEICDAIEIEGREVMAAFPQEMLLYVRQYSPVICMPFGREVIMGQYNDLHSLMEQDEIIVEKLAECAKGYGCHYIILSEEKKLIGEMEAYDYEVFGQVGEYIIYKDITMNFSV